MKISSIFRGLRGFNPGVSKYIWQGGYREKMNNRVTSYKLGSKISSRLQVTSYKVTKVQSYIFIHNCVSRMFLTIEFDLWLINIEINFYQQNFQIGFIHYFKLIAWVYSPLDFSTTFLDLQALVCLYSSTFCSISFDVSCITYKCIIVAFSYYNSFDVSNRPEK